MVLVCITLLFKCVVWDYRGFFSNKNYYKLTEIYKKYLLRHGIDFVEIYHFSYGHNKIEDRVCFCRKLYLGMILRAAQVHQNELSDFKMVGDKITHIIVAKNASVYKKIFINK